ncbi:MAG: acyltransferase [Verrucomicrobia bacterium]|nr:acyltransferase [Verrucomicrobiota bacterium]
MTLPTSSTPPLPSSSAPPLPTSSTPPLPSSSAPPLPSSSAPPLPTSSARFPALDALRACLTALVVVHHAVLAYHPHGPKAPPARLDGGSLAWSAFPVLDPAKWPGIDLLVGFNDYFFMSLMFLISGLFVPAGLARSGPGAWLRARAWRLGLPFVLGAALLAPLAYFSAYLQTPGTHSLAGFWAQWSALGVWPAGPVWFLWVLLAFGAVAALLHRIAPNWLVVPALWVSMGREHPWRFAALVAGAGVLAYVPMSYLTNAMVWGSFGPFFVQTARLPHYFLYFVLGLALGAAGIERGPLAADGRLARRWLLWSNLALTVFFAAVAAFVWFIVAAGQKAPTALPLFLASLGWPLSCAASSLAACAVAGRFAQRPGAILRSLSRNAFAIYVVHYPIVSWVQYALLDAPLSGPWKGMLAVSASLGLSWLVAAAVNMRSAHSPNAAGPQSSNPHSPSAAGSQSSSPHSPNAAGSQGVG